MGNGFAREKIAHVRRRDIAVLVTGFGPFHEQYPRNPSYEIIKSLPRTLAAPAPNGSAIHIFDYGHPIRASYEEIREMVPLLHESYAGVVDLVLHVGMATGRDNYALERVGHRDGYTRHRDLDGRTLPHDDGLLRFADCPLRMSTSLDHDQVLRRWRGNIFDLSKSSPAAEVECQGSTDAGHFVCDYIYFNSLAWFGRQNGMLEGGEASDRPVLFLHVPPNSDETTIAKGTEVVVALIEAMVETWVKSTANGRFG